MIEDIRRNIDTEIQMLREISQYSNRLEAASGQEKKLLEDSIEALRASIKIINNSIPKLIMNVSLASRLPVKTNTTNLEKVVFKREGEEVKVVLQAKDREEFFKALSINEQVMKKIKQRDAEVEEKYEEFKAARGYLKLSNKFFLNPSIDLINKGYFKPLAAEIKKANLDLLFETYVAMMLFSSVLSFFVGILVIGFFMIFSLGFLFPYLSFYSGDYATRLIQIFWIPLVLPVITFIILYMYPSTEKGSIAKQLDREIPFAVIHMSAISGSGIEPSEIFRIIGLSREYPYLRREIRKVMNQINLYGHDIVTALNNVSRSTPNPKLAELFSGLSTTISSGGNLTEFFEKRAETLLMGYRIEREKYTKVAETFMDIYISVVLAAPMILMILLVIIKVSGIQIGMSTQEITFSIIAIIALINLIFIGILHLKQPAY